MNSTPDERKHATAEDWDHAIAGSLSARDEGDDMEDAAAAAAQAFQESNLSYPEWQALENDEREAIVAMWEAAQQEAEECGAVYISRGHDPYSTVCDLAPGHAGPHQGDDPLGSDRRIEWRGGGSAGGDRLPYRDVRFTR